MLETLREIIANPFESLTTILNTPAFALWGPFFGLLMCGMGLPIPEDIILVVAGFLAGQNGHPILPPILVTYTGILLGDSFIFFVGKSVGHKILRSKLAQKILSPERLEKSREAFHKYGIWVNFFGRFLPGVRTAIFFTGGTLKYPFYKFFLMDGLAALISAPLFVWIGYWAGQTFNENIGELQVYLKTVKAYFASGMFVVFIIVALTLYIRSKKRKVPSL
ncbi:MAG: DedA family protein [Bdellovibrionota bacterium]